MDTDDPHTGDDGRPGREDAVGRDGPDRRGPAAGSAGRDGHDRRGPAAGSAGRDGQEYRERPTGPAGLRVGDADRGAALDALGEHLAAGRLDVDEFGDRSARAAVAVHRADLEVLFTDLPAPHPPLPQPPAIRRAPDRDAHPSPPAVRRDRPPVPAPAVGLGIVILLMMVLPVLAVGAATTGSAGGLLVLPLLFVVLGHVGHARRRWHGRGPGDHWGPSGRG